MIVQKTFVTVGSLGTVLLFGGGLFMYLNFGQLAKNITEKVASEALGVKVTIASLDVSLPQQKIEVRGLRVANPEGYSDPHALSVQSAAIKIGSMSKELIVFDDISVIGAHINLEVNQNGTNLNDIKKNVAAGKKPKAKSEAPAKDVSQSTPVKVVIKNMLVGDTKLTPRVLLIDGEGSAVIVPDIRLTGIGQKQNGILVRDAIGQVWDGVTKAATKSASGAGFLEGVSSDALKDMGAGKLQGLKDTLSNDIDELGSGIKGLFGN